MGWSFNWASSHESDFNFDLGVSAGHGMMHDPSVPLKANELAVPASSPARSTRRRHGGRSQPPNVIAGSATTGAIGAGVKLGATVAPGEDEAKSAITGSKLRLGPRTSSSIRRIIRSYRTPLPLSHDSGPAVRTAPRCSGLQETRCMPESADFKGRQASGYCRSCCRRRSRRSRSLQPRRADADALLLGE
jgi:hypothetical protein